MDLDVIWVMSVTISFARKNDMMKSIKTTLAKKAAVLALAGFVGTIGSTPVDAGEHATGPDWEKQNWVFIWILQRPKTDWVSTPFESGTEIFSICMNASPEKILTKSPCEYTPPCITPWAGCGLIII